jgi:hypothetical protein
MDTLRAKDELAFCRKVDDQRRASGVGHVLFDKHTDWLLESVDVRRQQCKPLRERRPHLLTRHDRFYQCPAL